MQEVKQYIGDFYLVSLLVSFSSLCSSVGEHTESCSRLLRHSKKIVPPNLVLTGASLRNGKAFIHLRKWVCCFNCYNFSIELSAFIAVQ